MASQSRQQMRPRTILCYGDSWTYGNAYGLKYALQRHNNREYKIKTEDLWGTEARYFAHNTHLLPNAVSKYNADYVLLSMGGNDFKNMLWKKDKQLVAPWTLLAEIKQNIEKVLDTLYSQHPNVKVVMYGYDFLGDVEATVSLQKVSPTYGGYLSTAYRWGGIRVINYYTSKLGSMLEEVAQKQQSLGRPMTYVPLWGTLQAAEEAEKENKHLDLDENISYSLGKVSPNQYMNDPIHANKRGYEILMTRLYQKFFAKEK